MASRTIHRYKRIAITPVTLREKLVFVTTRATGAAADVSAGDRVEGSC